MAEGIRQAGNSSIPRDREGFTDSHLASSATAGSTAKEQILESNKTEQAVVDDMGTLTSSVQQMEAALKSDAGDSLLVGLEIFGDDPSLLDSFIEEDNTQKQKQDTLNVDKQSNELEATVQDQVDELQAFQQRVEEAKKTGQKLNLSVEEMRRINTLIKNLQANLDKVDNPELVQEIQKDIKPLVNLVTQTIDTFKTDSLKEINHLLESGKIDPESEEGKRLIKLKEKLENLDPNDFDSLDEFLESIEDDPIAKKIIEGILANAHYDGENLILDKEDRDQIFRDAFAVLFKDDQDLLPVILPHLRADFLNNFLGARDAGHALELMEQSFSNIGVEFDVSSNKTSDEIEKQTSASQVAAKEAIKKELAKLEEKIEAAVVKYGDIPEDLQKLFARNLFITISEMIISQGPGVIIDLIRSGGGKLLDALGGIDAVKERMVDHFPELFTDNVNPVNQKLYDIVNTTVDNSLKFSL